MMEHDLDQKRELEKFRNSFSKNFDIVYNPETILFDCPWNFRFSKDWKTGREDCLYGWIFLDLGFKRNQDDGAAISADAYQTVQTPWFSGVPD